MAARARTLKPSPKSSPMTNDYRGAISKSAKDAAAKMHRRSRSGCFTCRLRRKKCNEARPICAACKHLGVDCEYERPHWWGNAMRRKQEKDIIKDKIKQTKNVEKGLETPPSLCHSLPTLDGACAEQVSCTHAPSDEHSHPHSHFSPKFEPDLFNSTPLMGPPHWTPSFPSFSPYEVDIKTEHQMFVNDVPTRTDSTISTWSTFPQHSSSMLPCGTTEQWVQQEYFESRSEHFTEEPVDLHFFEYPHEPNTPTRQNNIVVDEGDNHLLQHFLTQVARLVFPILDINQLGSAESDVILPALESNRCYLHCCLSIAGVHLKTTTPDLDAHQVQQLDNDIMRHRYAAITELCEAFSRDTEHSQNLEATLGLIFFESSVGSSRDGLPDIAWHQHFQAATSLIEKLQLNATASIMQPSHPSFNMTLASWIDILGATMLARVPTFAANYREMIESGASTGLSELMGCDDQVMFLISEIACLDSLKTQGMDHLTLCSHIAHLGEALTRTDNTMGEIVNVHSGATGAVSPRRLCRNITAIFRLAARIYLCSLVPEFDRTQPSITTLVDQISSAMAYIPHGFERSLVWPLLIAGSVSLPHSDFRAVFTDRCVQSGPAGELGSFGRMKELLWEVWALGDVAYDSGEKGCVHWRDVMRGKPWDFLLM